MTSSSSSSPSDGDTKELRYQILRRVQSEDGELIMREDSYDNMVEDFKRKTCRCALTSEFYTYADV